MNQKFAGALRSLRNWLLAPFEQEFPFFVLFFLLSTTIDVIWNVKHHFISYAGYEIGIGFFLTYALTLVICLIPKGKVRSLLKLLCMVLITIMFMLDVFCLCVMDVFFSSDFAGSLLNTNMDEAQEFVSNFVTPTTILVFACPVLLLAFLYRFAVRRNMNLRGIAACIAMAFALIGAFMAVRNPSVISLHMFPGKISFFFRNYEEVHLRDHLTHPQLVIDEAAQPENIVVIMGESLTRSHCSLFGYEKETNPMLKQLESSGLLFKFDHVNSAKTLTIPSFLCMLTTMKADSDDKKEWYEHTSLHETMQGAGYYCLWLSNQSQRGFVNSAISSFAELCDTASFVGNVYAGDYRKTVDGELVPLVRNQMPENQKNFYFIHLMGSHEEFAMRYPASFGRFSADDYSDKPENQRETLAEYDNSVLYNDSVVSALMRLFEGKDAVVVYLPDHGMDVYNSSPNFAGHANMTNPVSRKYGTEIPFVVYCSPKYRERHGEMVERIRASRERAWRSDDLIYAVMDLAGCDFEDGSVGRFSLFRK